MSLLFGQCVSSEASHFNITAFKTLGSVLKWIPIWATGMETGNYHVAQFDNSFGIAEIKSDYFQHFYCF